MFSWTTILNCLRRFSSFQSLHWSVIVFIIILISFNVQDMTYNYSYYKKARGHLESLFIRNIFVLYISHFLCFQSKRDLRENSSLLLSSQEVIPVPLEFRTGKENLIPSFLFPHLLFSRLREIEPGDKLGSLAQIILA